MLFLSLFPADKKPIRDHWSCEVPQHRRPPWAFGRDKPSSLRRAPVRLMFVVTNIRVGAHYFGPRVTHQRCFVLELIVQHASVAIPRPSDSDNPGIGVMFCAESLTWSLMHSTRSFARSSSPTPSRACLVLRLQFPFTSHQLVLTSVNSPDTGVHDLSTSRTVQTGRFRVHYMNPPSPARTASVYAKSP